jgi:hypothetical protein
MEFHHRVSAQLFLRRFRRDYFSMRIMRQAVDEDLRGRPLSRLDSHSVIDQLAGALVAGKLRIIEFTGEISSRQHEAAGSPEGAAPPAAAPQAAAAAPAILTPRKKDWIEIELVDEHGSAVENERCQIIDQDGNTRSGQTDDKGVCRIEELPSGSCQIQFPDRDRDSVAEPAPAPVAELEPVVVALEEEAEEEEPALEITSVDANFAPDLENLAIAYTIKGLSDANVLLKVTCEALGGATVYEYALTGGELTDGENKTLENWNGRCDRGPDELRDKFVNPLFSPYKVTLSCGALTSDEEEFAILYDSIRMSPGPWIPPDDAPDYDADVKPLLTNPIAPANDLDLTGQTKAIKWLQTQLNAQGYFAGAVDGDLGSAELKKAIRRYNCANRNAGQANFDCDWAYAYSVKDSFLDDANHGINKVTEGLLESLKGGALARVILDPDVFSNADGTPDKTESKLFIETHRFYVANGENQSPNSRKRWEIDRDWLSRPLFPVKVEILIRDKNGAGKAAGKAVGPVGVRWTWTDEVPDESHLLIHPATKTTEYVRKAHAEMKPDAPYAFNNLQEPVGGVLKGDDTDMSEPFVAQEGFPQFKDGDGVLFTRAFIDDGTNEALLGTTTVGFRSSTIGGDNYKLTAQIATDDDGTYNWAEPGNKNTVNTAHQGVQLELVRSSGKIEVWRQIAVAAYVRWSTAPDRIPVGQWTQVVAEYKAAFIDMVPPGAPVALDPALKGSIKAALKGADGNIMLDGTDTISGTVIAPRVNPPDPNPAIEYAEKLKLYRAIENLQSKYFTKLAEIVKAKYPDGVSVVDWSGHEKFNDAAGLNAFNNAAWTDYQSSSGSFGGPNGVAFVDHEALSLYAPYHLVAHEIGHTLFLEHWKNTAPIVDAHDQLDDNCIMSYLPLLHSFAVVLKMATRNASKAEIKVKAINAVGGELKYYDGDLTMTLQTTTTEPGWTDTQVVQNRRRIYKFPTAAFNKRSDGDFLPPEGSLTITSPEGKTKTVTWQSTDNTQADYIDVVWPARPDPVQPGDMGLPEIARGNAAHYRPNVYLPHFCGKCNLKLRGWDISAAALPDDSS